ncbi:MAG: hypothetical protein HRT69_03970 [Flavobacteriaceae bacterium]|nr:hypothetical protein [Flavobacteriaceae bacterium]
MTKQEITNLLQKNKNNLVQELHESKELVVLLTQSTTRNLTDEEKGKVKEQLLDICKSIPAFTVFMLPGGALLLPLLIKAIPNLLPSAFRD